MYLHTYIDAGNSLESEEEANVFVCLVNVDVTVPGRTKLTRAYKRNEPRIESSSMYENKWERRDRKTVEGKEKPMRWRENICVIPGEWF